LVAPASIPSMLLRSANNILNSLHMRGWEHDFQEEDHLNAGGLYGAGCIMALFGGHLAFLTRVLDENHIFLLDYKAIYLDLILKSLPDDTLERAEAVMAANRKIDKRQAVCTRGLAEIKFAVGMCLRHKRYGYNGAIVGWDPHCHQSDAWINQMQVDDLPRGRNQPFYHVLSFAGSEYYVAEENIEPIRVTPSLVLELFNSGQPVGQHFRSIAYPSSRADHGYLVPTEFLREAYPDDEVAARGF